MVEHRALKQVAGCFWRSFRAVSQLSQSEGNWQWRLEAGWGQTGDSLEPGQGSLAPQGGWWWRGEGCFVFVSRGILSEGEDGGELQLGLAGRPLIIYSKTGLQMPGTWGTSFMFRH